MVKLMLEKLNTFQDVDYHRYLRTPLKSKFSLSYTKSAIIAFIRCS